MSLNIPLPAEALANMHRELGEMHNPYPNDIFVEPTPEQFKKFNTHLKKCGLYPDAYNGSMGRRTWHNLMFYIKNKITQALAELKGKTGEVEG